MFVLNIRYSIRVKHLHFAFGCFSVCCVQTKLIMLCIIVPMYLYLFPITNHCCIVCLCKPVFTFTSQSLHQHIVVYRTHMETGYCLEEEV